MSAKGGTAPLRGARTAPGAGLLRVHTERVGEGERRAAGSAGRGGGDNGSESVLNESPDGMLAGRATTEIIPRHQDRGVVKLRLVELEVGVRFSVRQIPPVEK